MTANCLLARFAAIVLCLGALSQSGCGVKGDPLPPLEPPMIGEGRSEFVDGDDENPGDKNPENPRPTPQPTPAP